MSFDSVESSAYSSAPFELYRFSMGDQAWYLTSGEEARDHLGHTYAPDFISRTETEHNQEATSGNIEVTLPLGSELAKEFISFIPPLPMSLTIFAGHDGDSEVVVRFKGRVLQAKHGENCVLTVESGTSAIKKKIPPMVYQQSCNRIHYSPQCGATVDTNIMNTPAKPGAMKNAWVVKVGAISGFQITIDPFDAANADFVDGWTVPDGGDPYVPSSSFPADEEIYPRLSWGFATSTAGQKMMIAKHTGWNVFELKAPLVGLQVGDSITVTRGCRRTFRQCKFYKRTASYMAFDQMPSKSAFQGII